MVKTMRTDGISVQVFVLCQPTPPSRLTPSVPNQGFNEASVVIARDDTQEDNPFLAFVRGLWDMVVGADSNSPSAASET